MARMIANEGSVKSPLGSWGVGARGRRRPTGTPHALSRISGVSTKLGEVHNHVGAASAVLLAIGAAREARQFASAAESV